MVFNEIFVNLLSINHSLFLYLKQWVFVVLMIFSFNLGHATTLKEFKKESSKYSAFFGVIYDVKHETYSTLSNTNGEIILDKPEDLIEIGHYRRGVINFRFSSYKKFKQRMQERAESFTLFQQLPREINKILRAMKISLPINLSINLILVPKNHRIFYQSKTKSVTEPINLSFIISVNDKQLGDQTESIEKFYLDSLPHELFHFLVGFKKLGKMNELREETYAALFGECVAYNINPEIISTLDVLTFPDTFFIDPKKDLKKVINKVKKSKRTNKKVKILPTRFAHILALYYLQAVANNHTGKNIKSNTIPKFCHKLFSEHNFKHPIEKKPPPWFKEFLEENK